MSANRKSDVQFESDIRAVRRRFAKIISTLSLSEREENVRLRERIKHAAVQLRLCRELARSFDY